MQSEGLTRDEVAALRLLVDFWRQGPPQDFESMQRLSEVSAADLALFDRVASKLERFNQAK